MLGFALSILSRIPLKAWLILFAIAGAMLSGLYLRASYIAMGRQEALNAIKQANEKAQGDANRGIADVQKCFDAGLVWDRSRGVCNDTTR